ncbi:FadR/GntR family transcriptional regulator [Mesorhizobium sp. NZP2298]|uniref:FadR/GntR family transcriptional regulator n=1 Tax=Mesorhizobium sp. NZP2298 TaxID=2483403 RepID=UPI001551DD7F|nr:GntR family transcriptional regulator [Mesorhizobium sp. NZP2298]
MQGLALQLALLRGNTFCSIELSEIGRLSQVRMQIQKKPTLSDGLAVNMMSAIAMGRLPLGAPLPAERRLARATSLSRICVRYALTQLKSQGYVTTVRGSGTNVTDSVELLSNLLAANRDNLSQVSQFCSYFDEVLIDYALEAGGEAEVADAIGGATLSKSRALSPSREFELRSKLAALSGSRTLQLLVHSLRRGLAALFGDAQFFVLSGSESMKLEAIEETLLQHVFAADRQGARQSMRERSDWLSGFAVRNQTRQQDILNQNEEEELLQYLTTTQPLNLSDSVAHEIGKMIATGQLEVNDETLSERRLSDLFGVSRTTIQEALNRLKAQAILTPNTRPRSPAMVAAIALPSKSESARNVRELAIISQIRVQLESWSARRAANHGKDEDKKKLRRLLLEMQRPTEDRRRLTDLDMQFHLSIARIGGNALNLFVSETLRTMLLSYFKATVLDPTVYRRPDDLTRDEHAAVAAAIIGGNGDLADRSMRAHVDGFFQILQRVAPSATH